MVNYDRSETYKTICCPAQQARRDYHTFEHGVSIGLFPSGANDVLRLRNTTENCLSITKRAINSLLQDLSGRITGIVC